MPPSRIPNPAPTTQYRHGVRDGDAGQAHTDQSREWRRGLADAAFPEQLRRRFLMVLRRTPDIREAAEVVAVTHSQVYGRMSWDVAFERAVESILRERCRAGDICGRAIGYKAGGRCWACRAAKRGNPMRYDLT